MGIAFVLLGLLAAGVLVDFILENDLTTGAGQTYSLFGGSFTLSEGEVVIGAAVLGAAALLLVFLGIGLLRGSWGRRRELKHRMSELERENAELRSRGTLSGEVQVLPEAPATVHVHDAAEHREEEHADHHA